MVPSARVDKKPMNAGTEQMLSCAIPIAGLACNVVWQVIHCRASRGKHFMRTVAAGLAVGAVATVGLECTLGTFSGSEGWLGSAVLVSLPVYLCLGYGYANFVNLGNASVRIRIYAEIERSSDGLALEEIRNLYDEQSMMKTRVQRLEESGDIVWRDGHCHVNRSRFRWISDVIFLMKRMILGKESEFED